MKNNQTYSIIRLIVTVTLGLFLTACGGGGGTDTSSTTAVSQDITAPIVTLNGDYIVNLNVGDTWTDPGASAYDDVDGNLSVIISGSPDLTLVGTYLIRYTAIDSSGNVFRITRTVIVGWDTTQAVDTNITVLTIYTQKLDDYYAGEALTRIAYLFDYANQTLVNSGISMQYSVSDTYLDNNEFMVSTDLLNNLYEIDTVDIIAVGTLRDNTSSDLVYGFNYNEVGENVAGYAYIGTETSVGSGELWSDVCTGVVYAEEFSGVLIHEFGHTLGLDHDVITSPTSNSLETYGIGYGIDGDFATIMAYATNYSLFDNEPRYSSPVYTCGDNGLDCGINIGLIGEADAVSALIKWKDQVSVYR